MRGTRAGLLLRWTTLASTLVLASVLGAVAAGVRLARKAVTPVRHPVPNTAVGPIRRVDGRMMVTVDGPQARLPGRYSLLFNAGSGHAKLGPVLDEALEGVQRECIAVDRGTLREGEQGTITGWWYDRPEELGLRVEHILIPGEHGDAEAWLVHPKRPKKGRWAVHVHGRGALPQETLRGVGPFCAAGVTSLVISYRNDPGAPAGVRGRYGLGVSESRDVDSAIEEAVRRGATRVTLFGWSMGGTACLLSATEGSHHALIDGLVLDSPAIDWAALLRHQARSIGVPAPVANLGLSLLERGAVRGGENQRVDFGALSPERFASAIQVPVLIHASRQDTYVPSDAAERLAAANPHHVQLRLQYTGEHVRLWNVDPEPWERSTQAFVRALPRRGG